VVVADVKRLYNLGVCYYWCLSPWVIILKKPLWLKRSSGLAKNRIWRKPWGVKPNWVDAMTLRLGSGIAGIAGCALSQFKQRLGRTWGQGLHYRLFHGRGVWRRGNLIGNISGGLYAG